MPYSVNLKGADSAELLALVNHDNVGSVGEALTVDNTTVQASVLVSGVQYSAELADKTYPEDKVTVSFNKIGLNEIMAMTANDGDFDFYTPDTWASETSPSEAVAAFSSAADRAGIDVNVILNALSVERVLDGADNHFYLNFSFNSHVFQDDGVDAAAILTRRFRMPRHFSEEVSVTNLSGFYYEPIDPASVPV